MALTYGFYLWPIVQICNLISASGTFPYIDDFHMDQIEVPKTKGTLLDETSSGPGVIIWLAQDPTLSSPNGIADTWLTVDGTEIVTDERTSLSGDYNYIVGKVWEGTDEHRCYRFDLVWFKTGFLLEGDAGTYDAFMNCYWYELDWS